MLSIERRPAKAWQGPFSKANPPCQPALLRQILVRLWMRGGGNESREFG